MEEVFDMIMKNPPKKLLIILPEFKERDFWWQFDSISGELLSISHDSDAFYVENHPAGFRIGIVGLDSSLKNKSNQHQENGARNKIILSSGELLRGAYPDELEDKLLEEAE